MIQKSNLHRQHVNQGGAGDTGAQVSTQKRESWLTSSRLIPIGSSFKSVSDFILIAHLSRPVRIIALQNFAGFVCNNYTNGHTAKHIERSEKNKTTLWRRAEGLFTGWLHMVFPLLPAYFSSTIWSVTNRAGGGGLLTQGFMHSRTVVSQRKLWFQWEFSMLIMDNWLLSLPLKTNRMAGADESRCQTLLGDLNTCAKILSYHHRQCSCLKWSSSLKYRIQQKWRSWVKKWSGMLKGADGNSLTLTSLSWQDNKLGE